MSNEQLLDSDKKKESSEDDDEVNRANRVSLREQRAWIKSGYKPSKKILFPKISMECKKYGTVYLKAIVVLHLKNSGTLDDLDDKTEEDTAKSERRPLPATQIRKTIDEFFSKNNHPTAQEMQKLAQENRIKYITVFEMLEKKRKSLKIVCPKEDPCNRIRDFIVRENELLNETVVTEDVRRVMEHEIETHILSRQRFTMGHLHCVSSK